MLALQLLEPRRGGGDLQPADLVEAARVRPTPRQELLDGVLGEQGHRLRRVGLEDQPRGVGGRAAGQVERTLLDDGDVGPAAGDELVGEVGADDAGADDDDALGVWCAADAMVTPRVWSVRVSGRRRCCAPWSRIRFSQCQRTARESARHSASWPTVDEGPRVVGVVDPDHLLLDDRSLVELGGDVVRGGSDQLHAAGVGLVVGLGAFEAGQERVVDVDRSTFECPAEVVGQDLHVAGEHHQVDVGARRPAPAAAARRRPWCPA